MNVTRTREAVWAVAFALRADAAHGELKDLPREDREHAARYFAKRADLAVELFDLAVEPKGEAVEEGKG